MEGSWLSSALPRYRRPPSPEEPRRPRWRTPSPMAASMIPPPIVNSIYSPRPASTSKSSSRSVLDPAPDRALWTHRKQRQLESDLQILLDAQAEGLIAGLTGTPLDDEATSTDSSTPTGQSFGRGASSRRTASRPARKPNLKDARRGLYTTIQKLALVKNEELLELLPELEECDNNISRIQMWRRKSAGLRKGMQRIEDGEDHQKAGRLRGEANGMQDDIDAMEARLADLKTTQRRLRREADEIENTVQARLSSFTSSLTMMESDIARFLKEAIPDQSKGASLQKDTLELAMQSWVKDRERLSKQQADIESEREALEGGAVVWKDVVQEVSEFERTLQRATLTMSQSRDAASRHGSNEEVETGQDIGDLLTRMDQTTARLESQYKLAEARDWKLLICAIGAELEAFRKGQNILQTALLPARDAELVGLDGTSEDEGHQVGTTSVSQPERAFQDRGEEIRDLDSAFRGKGRPDGTTAPDTDTEDDGPDPELLISRQDTDTE